MKIRARSRIRQFLGGVILLAVFLARTADASESTERVKLVTVPFPAKVVKAQAGQDGTIHLLVDTTDGPQYAKSADSGVTFSGPISIVDAAARKPGLKFAGWDIAIGKDGRVHVAMSNNAWQLKLPQEEWSLYFATLAPGAKSFSPVRNLNRKPSEGFSLAADEQGNVTASFLSNKLYAMVSQDNGETWRPSQELNPAWDPCNCCTTSATYGSDGRCALLYREETNNERDMYVVLWDQKSGKTPLRTRVSRESWKVDACPMTYFTIAKTEAGYLAAWPTKGRISFTRLDSNGNVRSPGEILTPGTSGMRTGVVAMAAADGTTLIAWKNNDTLGWQMYDPQGSPRGKPGSARSPGNGAAGVVLKDGNFVLVL